MKQFLKSNLAIALSINIFFLVLCIIFGELRFGAMDDYFMAAVLTGAHGTDYNVHMYFVNALYGYALLPFYHLFPKIGWYYIGEMFGVFSSFTIVTYILLNKVGKYWGLILACLLLAFFCNDFYLQVQFTQCAEIFTATGMLAFIWGITEKKIDLSTLGCLMIFWGSLMRWQAFLMGMPYLGVAAFIQYKDCISNLKRIIIFISITIIMIYGARSFDQSLYNTPEYKQYKEIQGPRSVLGDTQDYNKEAAIKSLIKDGKSVDDFNMLRQWKFYDTEVFCLDSMHMYASYILSNKTKKIPLNEILGNILNHLVNSTGNFLCWIFFFFGIIILSTNPKRGLYPWLSLVVVAIMLAYLININRMVTRVENGFWIYASLLAIPQFGKMPKISRFYPLILIPLIFLAMFFYINSIPKFPKKQDVYNKVFEYIDSEPNTMFLLSMPQYAMFANHKKPPYLAEPLGSFKRTITFGFWTPYLPEITTSLKEFGIENPIKEIINENVIVVGDNTLGNFLQRHYYDSVKVDTIRSFDNVHFYKYSVVEIEKRTSTTKMQ